MQLVNFSRYPLYVIMSVCLSKCESGTASLLTTRLPSSDHSIVISLNDNMYESLSLILSPLGVMAGL